MLAALSAAALWATPAHVGLIGNGSFETLAVADSANCPGVPLGKTCVEGVGAKPQADGSEVASLLFRGAEKAGSTESSSELTVAFVRDLFGSATPSSLNGLDAVGLACAASPEVCRDKLFGTSNQGVAAGVGSSAGGASSAFKLGFMQSVGSVQVSPQYGLSFLQAGGQSAAKGGDTAGSTTSPERWEVSYGASSQPAAAVTSLEGSSGWSSSGLQFQSTSTSQVQSYMASGPSGLMGGGAQFTPFIGAGGGVTQVSEPPMLLLAGAALAGLWMQRRRHVWKD